MDLLRSQAAAAVAFLLRSLPPGVRERIKAALGALGHEPGWAHRLRARNLAQTVAAIPGAAVAGVEPLFKAGALLPPDIDLAFRSYDSADLRTSRIILVVHSSVLNEPGRDRTPTTGFPDVTAAGDSSPTPARM